MAATKMVICGGQQSSTCYLPTKSLCHSFNILEDLPPPPSPKAQKRKKAQAK